MKKQILNLGKALNKVEQKEINGGGLPKTNNHCLHKTDCEPHEACTSKITFISTGSDAGSTTFEYGYCVTIMHD